MHAERAMLQEWVGCLLDPARAPIDHLNAAQAWYSHWAKIAGMPHDHSQPASGTLSRDSFLPCGKAISPISAAQCIMDYPRTAVFLRAADAALRAAFARFPGETIHVLEAGSGPFAPLAFALAVRFSGQPVRFTLLDVHPEALAIAGHIAAALGLPSDLIRTRQADATTVEVSEDDRPHLIICELIQRALTREPQVAATLHLAPLLRPGGFFLPGRIEIAACLFDAHARYSQTALAAATAGAMESGVSELGTIFELDARRLPSAQGARLPAASLRVPAHHASRTPLHLLTRIHVFETHALPEFACAITLPEKIVYPPGFAAGETLFQFFYELGSEPQFRFSAENKIAGG